MADSNSSPENTHFHVKPIKIFSLLIFLSPSKSSTLILQPPQIVPNLTIKIFRFERNKNSCILDMSSFAYSITYFASDLVASSLNIRRFVCMIVETLSKLISYPIIDRHNPRMNIISALSYHHRTQNSSTLAKTSPQHYSSSLTSFLWMFG